MTTNPDENPQQPRPLFLYGPLQALPLLAWAMTGDPAKVDAVKPLIQPARVRGYARFALHGRDYAAVVKHPDASRVVDGLLFRPQNRSQRAKMDDFEGETHRAVQVDVEIVEGADTTGLVQADLYLWNADPDDVSEEEWDLEAFVRERLDEWLEFVGGMELDGDEDDEA